MASHSLNKPRELLKLKDISLKYDQFRALNHIDLSIGYSEIHAIVGEHGAGKSSLGMVISGILKSDFGRITFEGRTFSSLTLKHALKLGIEMVYQELCLNTNFTVAENLFFANKTINAFGWNSKKRLLNAAEHLLAAYNFDIDPSMPLKHLNLSDRAIVDILKHIYPQPKLLILDEALEKLAIPALNKMIEILKDLKRNGMSILFITHRIDDMYNFADRVSVIKNGEVLLVDNVKNIDKINLIKMTYTQISDGKTGENLNREFYQLLRYNEAILRNLPANLIIVDNERQIKMINDYCKQYFQLQKTSYLDLPLRQFFSDSNSRVLEILNNAFSSNKETISYEVPIEINGKRFMNNIKTLPIYDGTFLIGYIILIEDITEYNHIQKQMILSEKLASVGLLAAGVAHEINNPLEIIYNSLKYLKYNVYEHELREAVDDIQKEMTSIANIVSNLHSFSDDRQSTNEDIAVNNLIDNILKLIEFHAEDKHINIRFRPHRTDLFIPANKNEIKQVLLNLFKNSFEAMPSGGEIFIETAPILHDDRHMIQIRFQDTGHGIDDDNPDNIFLPFYSTKEGAENNLGLGLSVSYGIIKKYHGTIRVENIEGAAGCRFIINIPQSLQNTSSAFSSPDKSPQRI